LIVLHADDPRLYHGLVSGAGLVALVVSALAGTATLALVGGRRFELARYCAPIAVAAIVAGWALAQSPRLLPGLTVREAAASHDTLVSVIVAVVAGGALLFPALATLFRMTLGGRLSPEEAEREGEAEPAGPDPAAAMDPADPKPGFRTPLFVRLGLALLVAGIGLTNVADAEWAHIVGAVALAGCVVVGFLSVAPEAAAA
jgi:cytochrome d ubiquinol oxidase subunit II